LDDPEFDEIVSPLPNNMALQERIERLHRNLAALEAADEWGEARDRHFQEVDALADFLVGRDDEGGFEGWDWAAQFLTNEGFRNLYDHDKHWMMEDFIKDDAEAFLADVNWEARASTRMSKRELGNLFVVLSHFPNAGWGPQMLRLQRLLAR
jgi:hypothetical protein